MPEFPNIEHYYASLAELIEAGGSDNELSIRPAFQNCLAAYCAAHRDKLVLVPELATIKGTKPDGTIRDSLRMTRGHWEAKDTPQLTAEILEKFTGATHAITSCSKTPASPCCSRTAKKRCA